MISAKQQHSGDQIKPPLQLFEANKGNFVKADQGSLNRI